NANQGVLFRNENEQNAGHRNVFTGNTIENNGTAGESAGFYIGGTTNSITIKNNIIRSAGKGNQATAIFVGKNSSKITAEGNKITGSKEIVYEKK
ncbi:MAG: right-handed parallel beta-helix repeat-containing protein, partial [Bacteroidia bacterium]|nr:right-handed parallel beta-helix repeat-containing protein [Bacteroidia bacterium]